MPSSPSPDEDARLAALMDAVQAQSGGGRSRRRSATPGRAAALFGVVALGWVGVYIWLARITSDYRRHLAAGEVDGPDGWGVDPLALGLLVVLLVGAPVLVFLLGAFIVRAWRARRERDGGMRLLLGCAVVLVISGLLIAGAGLRRLFGDPFTAASVMDDFGLPAGAEVIERHDSGTASASLSEEFVVTPTTVTAESFTPPAGFSREADPTRLGVPECNWRTKVACTATQIAIFNGRGAEEFANGSCTVWITQQSNRASLGLEQRPVVVVYASCSEGIRRQRE